MTDLKQQLAALLQFPEMKAAIEAGHRQFSAEELQRTFGQLLVEADENGKLVLGELMKALMARKTN